MRECGWDSTSAPQTPAVLGWANRSRNGHSITTSLRWAATNRRSSQWAFALAVPRRR